jgi:hypothetical protein
MMPSAGGAYRRRMPMACPIPRRLPGPATPPPPPQSGTPHRAELAQSTRKEAAPHTAPARALCRQRCRCLRQIPTTRSPILSGREPFRHRSARRAWLSALARDLADPSHREHREIKTWVGRNYVPEKVDARAVNREHFGAVFRDPRSRPGPSRPQAKSANLEHLQVKRYS